MTTPTYYALQAGQIVNNLAIGEPAKIIKINPLGDMISIHFVGMNSRIESNKMLRKEDLDQIVAVSHDGLSNFSGNAENFSIYMEAERIRSAYQFDPLFAVNCSIVDPLPHQVEAVYRYLLPQPRIRFLLADDTGAGKTIMTGLLLKELMMRDYAKRILIITPGGLTKQWVEDEMGEKFNIPFKLLNRAIFNAEPNIFSTAERLVTSIDFISREDILNIAKNSSWDLIIFDEAHKLSAYDYGQKKYESSRYKCAKELAKCTEHLLLLTATPHRGRQDTFRSLMQLLDEDIFATDELTTDRVNDLNSLNTNRYFIRRLKEDMRDWEGKALYKSRFTKTVSYELTKEESELYEAVTNYLTKQKKQAEDGESKNIYVSLALSVLQRRLASSIYAINNTLHKRLKTINDLIEAVLKAPSLLLATKKIAPASSEFDISSIDDFDDLDDEQRESLDTICSDPKKLRLFTTARSIEDLKKEADELQSLCNLSKALYERSVPEQKFIELQKLLENEIAMGEKKLVIFTEHKDTLLYLHERLSDKLGYRVATIHGGKSVDERRQAQWDFSQDAQILLCTDAAGEGINLQFCQLLINWDIPWNPNRLEQRMGRIHRYGQQSDVLVFNMVASNTREGNVLERLLTKLDIIRQNLGDDRVYDVIQDVLQGVNLASITQAVFDAQENDFTSMISGETGELQERFKAKIEEQKNSLDYSRVDYSQAGKLKSESDEKKLQPIYIQRFFEKAFKRMGGDYKDEGGGVYRITHVPEILARYMAENSFYSRDRLDQLKFCFDKEIFLKFSSTAQNMGSVHYINPGNLFFDALSACAIKLYKEDAVKGTMLISASDRQPYLAYLVRSRICDGRSDASVIDERLSMVIHGESGELAHTSAAKFLDLHSPTEFAKSQEPTRYHPHDEAIQWTFENITKPQFEEISDKVLMDIEERKQYVNKSFEDLKFAIMSEINALQGRELAGRKNVSDKIKRKEEKLASLDEKKQHRLDLLDKMSRVSPVEPVILGCAYVVPLTNVEYEHHYGMSRDDDVEAVAMEVSMKFESESGRSPEDVSAKNLGYDISSRDADDTPRYIEVKGRSASGHIMLSENEMNRLAQLGDSAWLYIVAHCKSNPHLTRIQNPAKVLTFDKFSKGVQYLLDEKNWRRFTQ